MAKNEKQRERGGLGAVVPILLNDIERLDRRLAGLKPGAPGIANAAIGGGMTGWLLVAMPTYEGEANEFGELKAAAEDMVDDALNDLGDLDRLVDAVKNGTNPDQRASQAAARAKAQKVADAIKDALDKAREARGKAKGAAAAAKKLAAANPKLDLARASFRDASEKLHDYDRAKGTANTKDEIAQLAVFLKAARDKIHQDLAHLNAAMELVV